jgi:hypothetical protein
MPTGRPPIFPIPGPSNIVSVMHVGGDPPFEDVLPHCDDYGRAAHLRRLFMAACAARDISVSESDVDDASMTRYSVGFCIESGSETPSTITVPSGYLDALVATICERIVAHIGDSPIHSVSVWQETDAQMSAVRCSLVYKTLA